MCHPSPFSLINFNRYCHCTSIQYCACMCCTEEVQRINCFGAKSILCVCIGFHKCVCVSGYPTMCWLFIESIGKLRLSKFMSNISATSGGGDNNTSSNSSSSSHTGNNDINSNAATFNEYEYGSQAIVVTQRIDNNFICIVCVCRTQSLLNTALGLIVVRFRIE